MADHSRRGKYSLSHYSPRLKRMIDIVFTQEVISTKSERGNHIFKYDLIGGSNHSKIQI